MSEPKAELSGASPQSNGSEKSVWNQLEIAKLAAGMVMPLVILIGGFLFTAHQDDLKRAQQLRDDEGRAAAAALENGRRTTDENARITQQQAFTKSLHDLDQRHTTEMAKLSARYSADLQRAGEQWQKRLHDEDVGRAEAQRKSDERRAEAQERARINTDQQLAARTLSHALRLRGSTASLLIMTLRESWQLPQSIRREELVQIRRDYDRTVIEYSASQLENTQLARQAVNADKKGVLPLANAQNLLPPLLSLLQQRVLTKLDKCVYDAYFEASSGGDPRLILDACDAARLALTTEDCGAVLPSLSLQFRNSIIIPPDKIIESFRACGFDVKKDKPNTPFERALVFLSSQAASPVDDLWLKPPPSP